MRYSYESGDKKEIRLTSKFLLRKRKGVSEEKRTNHEAIKGSRIEWTVCN